MKSKIVRIIFIILGSISLALGAIGATLPVLPTTPFLLLTLFCYARGSKKFHDWFTGTFLYKKYLESFVANRSLTLKTKLSILISASAMLLTSFILVDNIHIRIFILFLVFCKYFYFFKFIKTIPKEENVNKNKAP